ncbi:acyltransferase domain-containing protein [Rhodococcus sp. MTM3W5.2]|uniref:acyltransferase domain-containing protein n=1 Tax=Rhodococcus sp. MTM3W5.2 TaxID=1805827 RepID=UPI003982D9F1
MGGANYHVVFGSAQRIESDANTQVVSFGFGPMPWVISARSVAALSGQARRLHEFLIAEPGADAVSVGRELLRRSRFEHRAVIVGSDRQSLLDGLNVLASGGEAAQVIRGVAAGGAVGGKTVLVFPGQGSQWVGMGQGLCEAFPVFAAAFEEAVGLLDDRLGLAGPLSVGAVLWSDDTTADADGLVDNTLYAQAGLFAVGVGVWHLLQSWGVSVDAVAGHSIGEVAAAYAAGVLDLGDAVTLVAARARLMAGLPEGGAMAAVGAEVSVVQALLAGVEGADIAAVNSDSSVVVSGEAAAVEQVSAAAEQAGWRVTRLRVSHAFHSRLMDPMLGDFLSVLEGLSWRSPQIALVSNLDGSITAAEAPVGGVHTSPRYWVEHVRGTVRFADGIAALAGAGGSRFVVAGPDGGLSALIQQTLGGQDATVVPVLRRGRDQVLTAVSAAVVLDTNGAGIDWAAMLPAAVQGIAPRVGLPTYAFDRQRMSNSSLYRSSSIVDAQSAEDKTAEVADGVATKGVPLSELLAGLPSDQHLNAALNVVRQQAAHVLAYGDVRAIDSRLSFKSLGFDSLTALEFRKSLESVTGLLFPATLIFDYPTPEAVAELICHQVPSLPSR